RSIATLAGTADGGDAAHALEADAASMKRQLDEIAATVDQRLAATAERERAVRAIEAAHHGFAEIIVPLLDDASFDMTTARGGDDKAALAAAQAEMAKAADLFGVTQSLYDLRAESNLVFGLLTAAATAPGKERLPPLRDSLTATVARIGKSFAGIAGAKDVA